MSYHLHISLLCFLPVSQSLKSVCKSSCDPRMEATSDIALFSQQPNKVPVDRGCGCFQAAREGMDAVMLKVLPCSKPPATQMVEASNLTSCKDFAKAADVSMRGQ